MLRWALALIFVSAFALTAAAGSEPAVSAGGNNCSTRANVLSHLAHKYSEAPIAIGLAENGGVIEVLSSTEGGTWTIIVTMPDGTSCMVAAGEDWKLLPKIAAKSKDPRI